MTRSALEPPLVQPPSRHGSGDEDLPELVRELFLYSRPPFKDLDIAGFVEENAFEHHTFVFKYRPRWRIDAYRFSWKGIPTEFAG